MLINVIQVIQLIHNFSKVVLTETKNHNNTLIYIYINKFILV